MARGNYSHAEGYNTITGNGSNGYASHAEGYYTIASNDYAHAQNYYTIAAKRAQTALGTYNVEDTATTTSHPNGSSAYGTYAVIVGNGTSQSNRSDAARLKWNGDFWVAGNVTSSTNVQAQSIELLFSTPFIDFHYNNSTADYTARLISDGANFLTLQGSDLRLQNDHVDVQVTYLNTSYSNNNLSSTIWPSAYCITDMNNTRASQFGCEYRSDGTIGTGMWSYKGSYMNWIVAYINQNNVASYSIANAANFRSAIGAAASSDRRLKKDIKPLGREAVEFVKELKPASYVINGEKQIGFIAQDVHESDRWGTRMAFETQEGLDGLDEWEKMPDGSPTWKLDYIRIIPALAAALKSSMEKIEKLEDELFKLKLKG